MPIPPSPYGISGPKRSRIRDEDGPFGDAGDAGGAHACQEMTRPERFGRRFAISRMRRAKIGQRTGWRAGVSLRHCASRVQ
jgi:hypothetical protein